MNGRLRAIQRRSLALLFALCGVMLLTVCSDVNGPNGSQHAQLAFAPAMDARASAALGSSSTVIDNVHVVIRRLDGTIVFDAIVAFPAGGDEVAIQADVPVHGDNEQMRATIQLRSGNDVLFEGEQNLTVFPGEQPGAPPSIPLAYVGTGANAASVTISPGDATLNANSTTQFTAVVRDAGGNVIPNVPIGWTSSNEAVVSVSGAGSVAAHGARGTATIAATTFGGVGTNTSVRVTLPPSQIRVVSGNAQEARVSTALPVAFTVELLAADGVVIPNFPVAFTASQGATITPASVTTDVNGRASATMTLGTKAGAFTFGAAAAGLTASIGANALPGEFTKIVISGGDAQSALTGAALPQPLAVLVTDEFGNPGNNRVVNWSAAAGTFGAASSTTNSLGIATNSYTLPFVPGPVSIAATLPAGVGVNFAATAIARPPATVTATSGASQSGLVGRATLPMVVRVLDALNQPLANTTVTWSVTGTATLGGATSTTNTDGFASMSGNFGPRLGTSTVRATVPGGVSATFTLIANAGPPANMAIAAGDNQRGAAGSPVPITPSVLVTDASGVPVAGVVVTFGAPTGGGSVRDSIATTDANGIATVGSWTLGTATTQTLTATAGTLSVVFHATASLPVAFLGAGAGDGQIVTQSSALQPFTVHAMAANESSVAGATIRFTVQSGSASPTIFTSVTDANGQASFTATAGAAGSGVVHACVMPACVISTDFTYTVITAGTIWTGATSSNWFTASNWSTGVVPTSATNVFIPASTPNGLTLTGNVVMNNLFMADGSFMFTGTFEMAISGNATTTNAFLFGNGSFRMSGGTASLVGNTPSLIVDGTITTSGATSIGGNVTIENAGRLVVASAVTVNGGFNIDPGGHLSMNAIGSSLAISGDAFFNGANMGDTDLTAGLLDVKGNFTATGGTQAFRAAGTHTTRLSGINLQTMSFGTPGATNSRFQNLDVNNPSANGVTMASNVYVNGTLSQGGTLTIPNARVLTIVGVATLQAGSLTTATGAITFGSCVNLGGTAVGFTC